MKTLKILVKLILNCPRPMWLHIQIPHQQCKAISTLFTGVPTYSGAPAARRAAKRSPILIWETKGKLWVDFLMVIMASDIAPGRVGTTTTTTEESRKMAAILQIIGWQRHATLVYCVLFWYWTSMLWSIDTCQNQVSADQYSGQNGIILVLCVFPLQEHAK